MKRCLQVLIVLLVIVCSANAELKLWYQMDSADDFNLGEDIGGYSGRTYVTNAANGELASGMTAHSGIYFDSSENALYMNGVHPCKIMGQEDGDVLFTGRTQYTFSLWAKADLGAVSGNGYSFYLWFDDGSKFKCDLGFQTDKSACFSAPGGSWQNNVSHVWDPDPAYADRYVDPEEWNMYTFTWDADNNYIATYINGTERAHYIGPSGDVPAIASGASVTDFGFGDGYGWHGPGGWYKDFRVYDHILNESEMITLLNPVDINGDKSVDYDDFEIITDNWLESDGVIDGDLNWDGVVNFNDYAIWANNLVEGGKYYFDSVNGDDNNSGTSPDEAWQSLNKFNGTTFLPGDKIYFKTYSTWTGQLRPKGSGEPGAPIVIDAYGDIYEQEIKPCFNGAATTGSTLYIRNVEYWEINNLQITNQGATAGDWRTAVAIRAENFGTMDSIHLKDLYVHSVNSTAGTGGGISWFCSSNGGVMTKFDDILIEGCLIENLGSWAIQGGNTHCGRIEDATEPENTKNFYPSTNVVVRGNRISNIDSSGIVIIGTDGCVVEYNVIDKTMRTDQGGCGIWPWSADNTIIQYNEVYDVYDNGDGESYDSDYNCRGTIFQYNYSHDNPGGFMRICNGGDYTMGITGNHDTIIRYNISVNDGKSDDAIFPTWKEIDNAQIYNNVIYSPNATVCLVDASASGGGNSTYHWWNNILYSNGTLRYDITDGATHIWSHNCFYGTHQTKTLFWWSNGTPSDSHKVTANPNFVSASLSAPMGIDNLDGFKIQSGSPCENAGMGVTNNGGYDFWGGSLYVGSPDIGAEEN